MTSTRIINDVNQYSRDLTASTGTGNYTLEPNIQCDSCFTPNIPNSQFGNSVCTGNLIDVDSELMGLNVVNTKCPEKLYLPSDLDFCNFKDENDCPVFTGENTRLSNPPCTLRGTGWNRWEWLCQNPQDKAIMPNERFLRVNTTLMTKDNFKACVPTLADQSLACPKSSYNDPEIVMFDDTEMIYGQIADNDFTDITPTKCAEIARK